MTTASRGTSQSQEPNRPAVPRDEHWKFAYNSFRRAWSRGDVKAMRAWTLESETASRYDPNWHARTDDLEEIGRTDPELASILLWAANETTRRYHEERDDLAPALIQPEQASDWYCGTVVWHRPREYGPDSPAVRGGLATSTAGWQSEPTGREFYDAARASEPTGRQRAILYTFLAEATGTEWQDAWGERAFRWRDMIRHAHDIALPPDELIPMINAMATSGMTAERRAFEREHIDEPWRRIEAARGCPI